LFQRWNYGSETVKKALGIAIIGIAALLSGCAAGNGAGPIDVTRFHLGQPIAGDSVAVQPLTGYAGISPEDQVYVGAVSNAMIPLGFAPTPGDATTYIAAVSYKHVSQGTVRKRPAVTIGLGAGSFSGGRHGGVGVEGGGSFGIGGGHAELISTELNVQIKRRSDNSIVWEGHATTEGLSGPGAMTATTADRLAKALFKGFPGESGITITVK
jgi:hypothetical protein